MVVSKAPPALTAAKIKEPLAAVAGYEINVPGLPAAPDWILPDDTIKPPDILWAPDPELNKKLAVAAPESGMLITWSCPTDPALLIVVLKAPPVFCTAARISDPPDGLG